MCVFHVIVGLDVGGAENMLKRLIDSDGESSSKVVVISLTAIGSIGEVLSAQGVKVHALGMTSILGFPSALLRLFILIRRYRPTIVQTWMYHADLLGGLAARLAGNFPVIWGVRTTEIRAGAPLATRVVRWLCARLSSWVPNVIVCAAEASRYSHIKVGYDEKKLIVVPNGYDFGWLKATFEDRKLFREQSGICDDDVVLGSMGRFHEDKNQECFVRAAGLLALQYPKLRFLMVGRGLDWCNEQLVDWIDSTGYRERFILLGERQDVPQCLAGMDIFCLHSRTEGFPNVLAEAMAMGLPCVATNVGDAAMLVADAGMIVPKEDAVALSEGVSKVLRMPAAKRSSMGARARKRITTEFSIQSARERFQAVYASVLAGMECKKD